MKCFVEMVDCSTGEILYNKNLGYAFAIGMPNDVGMSRLREVLESAIKGARIKRVPLQVRFCFTEPKQKNATKANHAKCNKNRQD